jgi:TusA-related sulfurtransferase
MKLLLAILLFGTTFAVLAQDAPKQGESKHGPKYNPAAEAVYKGTVDDLRDRECPVSSGMGSHIMLKVENGDVIEVHLASVEFTKLIEMDVKKGDSVEVTGWKTDIDGTPAILAREVKHEKDVFTFRTKEGTPAWTR